MKPRVLTICQITIITLLCLLPVSGFADDPTSAYGKYRNLVQKLTCPSDSERYGKYRDYGYWSGGKWCGQNGKAGYWVWVNPTWHIWANKSIPARANVKGKYANLLQIINCPRDRISYGKFSDYGFWGGGKWCGQTGKSGYWVYLYPDWYVWAAKSQ